MLFRLLALAAAAHAGSEKEFPPSWGTPPEIQTMDYAPLAGGYGHGSSSLSRWIQTNIDKDLAAGKPQYPPAFGEPPRAQTRDYRPLPFGYGSGSGTIAKWLAKRAQEVYSESPKEFHASGEIREKHRGRDMRPVEMFE
mmetsp:Transcript_89813/g.159736  ORF Transcript_89813/g.159736 Transcript_89813/m.159736 type:complete len:139 (+) Transcript_89813:76-492(+)|eukprot:CAMPEP_0197655138 /NCGR_PEP_ID=MMETSP1338-20131121/39274_1 /TAXON_ID=43686 ORGANISM="Pelagodinium beii, Strain RCC1491" /NCGR_SAMPLE_ID=MMETSP1338 /ASSEMBLY_ACC=CAM_ASM_000754 /LENGTH=138 /DNA_ID=CAMNT_0043230727 /DNA_START=75 /DNA_END=491 /DNA_ORIENTATION=+